MISCNDHAALLQQPLSTQIVQSIENFEDRVLFAVCSEGQVGETFQVQHALAQGVGHAMQVRVGKGQHFDQCSG